MPYAANSGRAWTRERLLSGGAAVLLQALLGYALITGLGVRFPAIDQDAVKLFAVAPPPSPPPPQPMPQQRASRSRIEGEASARNLRSRATPVAAPEPAIVQAPPPPVITAPRPFVADDPTSGSAAVRGPGTGAGGIGNGFGSGGSGDGDGNDGDGIAEEVGPQFLRGSMSTSDLPESLFVTGFNGTVAVRYMVAENGRVADCRITRSSGNAVVDATTCRLLRQHFRFRPARDGHGRPVASWIVENHSWEVAPDSEEVVETPRKRRLRLW